VAWLGLARVAASPEASLDFARRAARLKPDDPLVQKVLAWAENKQQATSNSQQLTVNGEQLTDGDEQELVASNQHPLRHWPTAVSYAAIIFMGIILLGLGGLFIWNNFGGGPEATAESVVAEVSPQATRSLPELVDNVNATAVSLPATATPSPTYAAIQPKQIADHKEDEPRPTWTITPTPTNTPTPTPTPVPTFISANNRQPAGRPFGVGANERWIDVNLSSQTLTAYEGNTAVYDTYISSGLPAHPTVTGQFRIWLRYASQTMDGSRLGYDYYLTNVPYVMYFYEDYALHGTYWHNNFGYPMSHGCVNMYTPDAQWVFNWSTIGTVVNVHY
jgi:lipoprotein-anchoring transpeptidase ErfK/SrfK